MPAAWGSISRSSSPSSQRIPGTSFARARRSSSRSRSSSVASSATTSFPHVLEGDGALRAVRAQQLHSAPAQLRLQRARRVVDARVYHAAVPAGLMRGDLVLLLEHGDRRVGLDLGETPCDGEADDPGADDADAPGAPSQAAISRSRACSAAT